MGQSIPHVQAVLQGAQHAHLVRGHGAHPQGIPPAAPPDVAAADDHGGLDAQSLHLGQDAGHLLKLLMAEQLAIHTQGLPAELDDHAAVRA